MTSRICMMGNNTKENLKSKKNKRIIAKTDLKNTVSLKTAIIENECIINFNSDIFEGPKYLFPLIELIE